MTNKVARPLRATEPGLIEPSAEFRRRIIMSALEIVKRMTDSNYVPPISPYQLGRQMFNQGIAYASCTTDAMRSGWLAAEGRAMWAEYQFGGLAAANAVLAATL